MSGFFGGGGGGTISTDPLAVVGDVEMQDDSVLWLDTAKTIGLMWRSGDGYAPLFSGDLTYAEELLTAGVVPGSRVDLYAQSAGAASYTWLKLDKAGSCSLTLVGAGNVFNVKSGSSSVFQAGANGIGEYNHAPAAQSGAIIDASGGVVQDAEARTAINTLLAYLRSRGTVAA